MSENVNCSCEKVAVCKAISKRTKISPKFKNEDKSIYLSNEVYISRKKDANAFLKQTHSQSLLTFSIKARKD